MLDDLDELAPWDWPSDANERIAQALRAPDRAERFSAAELGGRAIMDLDLARALLERLVDDDEEAEIRARVAIALGPTLESCDIEGFDDPIGEPPVDEGTFEKIVSALERIYRDANAAKEVRRCALEAAVRAPREWQNAAVRAAWASGDVEWRTTAAFCMGYLDGFAKEQEEAYRTGDADIVRGAMRGTAGGGRDLSRGVERLIVEIARSRDPELIGDAIEALASGKTDESLDLLHELSASDDDELAELAYEALALRGATVPDDDSDW